MNESFQHRAADAISSGFGNLYFLSTYLGLTVIDTAGHLLGFFHFDPYPFQFYTFSVSVLAIVMSNIILMAGNRQQEIDRQHNELAHKHTEEILALQLEQMAILRVLHSEHELLRTMDGKLTALLAITSRIRPVI